MADSEKKCKIWPGNFYTGDMVLYKNKVVRVAEEYHRKVPKGCVPVQIAQREGPNSETFYVEPKNLIRRLYANLS